MSAVRSAEQKFLLHTYPLTKTRRIFVVEQGNQSVINRAIDLLFFC